jgi:hypothetical protein
MKTETSVKQLKILNKSITLVKVAPGKEVEATMIPMGKLNLGRGKGKPIEISIKGSMVGIIFDTRGRPLRHPMNKVNLKEWANAFNTNVEVP